jgi:peroxiredoxin
LAQASRTKTSFTAGLTSGCRGRAESLRKPRLFPVPSAFTPTCPVKHLPGFVQHVTDFKAKGVDLIACTSLLAIV